MENRNLNWTAETVDIAIREYAEKPIAPVVIISYKRGGKASSIQLMKNTNVPTYLFVYDDDYNNYKEEVENSNNIKVILCPSQEFRGAAKKRDFVQANMFKMGFEDYFILDDDITKLYYTKPGLTKSGKYKAEKVEITPEQFFKTWYYIIHNIADYTPALGGVISEASSWCQDLNTLPYYTKSGRVCQIAYINAKLFNQYDIKYKNIEAWDDFDVQLQVYKNGLDTINLGWLTYSGDTMTPKNSIASGGDYTWTKKSMNLYKTWGEYVGFKVDKGQLNSTFKWSKIKKDLAEKHTLVPIYNNEWYNYFFNDTDEIDYLGFTKLWQNKIDEWNEKHLPKKKSKAISKEPKEGQDVIEGQLSLFDE